MTFEDFLDAEIKFSDSKRDCALKAWNHQQAKIDHIREYLTSGMEVATENSEYWLALRDCLNELDWIKK